MTFFSELYKITIQSGVIMIDTLNSTLNRKIDPRFYEKFPSSNANYVLF